MFSFTKKLGWRSTSLLSKRYISTQTALVTGCNRGLGLEWIKQLVKPNNNLGNFEIYACCRNPSIANELNELASIHKNKIHIRKLESQNDNDMTFF